VFEFIGSSVLNLNNEILELVKKKSKSKAIPVRGSEGP
jgi:hypothetical protein